MTNRRGRLRGGSPGASRGAAVRIRFRQADRPPPGAEGPAHPAQGAWGGATTGGQRHLQRGVPQLVPGPPAAVLRGGAPLPGDVGAEAAELRGPLPAYPLVQVRGCLILGRYPLSRCYNDLYDNIPSRSRSRETTSPASPGAGDGVAAGAWPPGSVAPSSDVGSKAARSFPTSHEALQGCVPSTSLGRSSASSDRACSHVGARRVPHWEGCVGAVRTR